ncbi:MAG: M20 family metallopeptidase [Candidatus Bathyarchaeota archaeon]|nr:M20 family metallopeptidase [Candidatus Bathyarchaeota archaeon]
MSVNTIMAQIDRYRDELLQLCSKLIQCSSAHPAGRTVECVEVIREYCDQVGIKTTIHAKDSTKPNIVAQIPNTPTAPQPSHIAWVGHLDVVPEGKLEDWTHPPYKGDISSDGTIWGRGASDMKGACAAALVAARVLKAQEQIPNKIDFWFTADEEVGGINGARWLAHKKILQGDLCIIGDGSAGTLTNPAIDIGCKGIAGTRLIARGKTAHGSRPYLGENALDKILGVIPFVKQIGRYQLDIPSELAPTLDDTIQYLLKDSNMPEHREAIEELFQYPSVTLNLLSGGVKNNVVPDYAEAYFDIRLTPGCTPQLVRDRILSLVRESEISDITVEFPRASDKAGYYESPDSHFARTLSQSVYQVTGNNPIFKILTGGTDAVRIKRFIDIPCLGFGACIEGQAHVPDEHNHVTLLLLSCKVYAVFPVRYHSKPSGTTD